MCMKRTGKIKVAKKDIPVWKVIRSFWYDKSVVTPFQFTPIQDLSISVDLNTLIEEPDELAGYHCYPLQSTARALRRELDYIPRECVHVVKMYIPKGAKYVEGVDYLCTDATDGKPAIQAERLLVSEKSPFSKRSAK